MSGSYVKKCKEHIDGFRNKINQYYKVKGILPYSTWSVLNDFYNNGLAVGELKNLETINNNLNQLSPALSDLLTKVNNCKTDIANASFSQDYIQMLKNAKMFEGSSQEENINSLMDDMKMLKNSISDLSSLCSDRINELKEVYENSFSLISEIKRCQAELANAYSVQTEKKENDEREVVDEIQGERYYFYLSEPGQPKRPNKLSVEKWWDFDPYVVSG